MSKQVKSKLKKCLECPHYKSPKGCYPYCTGIGEYPVKSARIPTPEWAKEQPKEVPEGITKCCDTCAHLRDVEGVSSLCFQCFYVSATGKSTNWERNPLRELGL